MKQSKKRRRVLLLCFNPYIRIEFLDYLQSLLGEYLTIDANDPSSITSSSQLADYHCILFSTKKTQDEFLVPVPDSATQIVCTRTFNHAYLDQIIQIPPNEKVYVVNDVMDSTLDTIQQFQDFGITQYQFIPWFGASEEADLSVRYAIAVGELQLVPKHVRNVINIGNRIIDISTVNELCTLFRLPASLGNQITKNYISHIIKVVKTAGNYYSSFVFSQQLLLATASNLPISLCLLDESGRIILLNKNFASDWALSEKNAAGKPLSSCLPEIFSSIPWDRTADYHLPNPEGIPFLLSVMELSFPNHARVCLLISKKVTDIKTVPFSAGIMTTETIPFSFQEPEETAEMEPGQSGMTPVPDRPASSAIHGQFNKLTGSTAESQISRQTDSLNHHLPEKESSPVEQQRNSFLDFISASAKFQEILSYAKRMSLYDFPLLIQGEDGTQKKMLAHAIHRSSSRRNGPFICLNQMLTLSEFRFPQILDAASHGTLLVDNIQRLSPDIQELLVQVLQSPSFHSLRALKNHDIRIIATSSQDLYALVREGAFRQDLFFQLSTAVIDTIPLKKRREDIPLLFRHFFQGMFHDPKFHNETILSKSLYQFLLNYDYPGNVQELINLAQYFYSMYAAHPLILSQLPSYIRHRFSPAENSPNTLRGAVLSVIKNSPRAGRTSIQKALAASGVEISDGRLRGLLKELAEENLILVHRTKGGCEITEAGLAILAD